MKNKINEVEASIHYKWKNKSWKNSKKIDIVQRKKKLKQQHVKGAKLNGSWSNKQKCVTIERTRGQGYKPHLTNGHCFI